MKYLTRALAVSIVIILPAFPLFAQEVNDPSPEFKGIDYHHALSVNLMQGATISEALHRLFTGAEVNNDLAMEYYQALVVHVRLARNDLTNIESIVSASEKDTVQPYLTGIENYLKSLTDSLQVLQQGLQAKPIPRQRLENLTMNMRSEFSSAENDDHRQIILAEGINERMQKWLEAQRMYPEPEEAVSGIDYHHALSIHLDDGAETSEALGDLLNSDDWNLNLAKDYYEALDVHLKYAKSDLSQIESILSASERTSVSKYLQTIQDQLQSLTDSLAALKQGLQESPVPKQRLIQLVSDMQTQFRGAEDDNHRQIEIARGIVEASPKPSRQ